MKYLLAIVCLFVPLAAAAQEQETYEDLGKLVESALTTNPEISASEARWEMYRNRAQQADVWEDPMIMFKIQNGMVRKPLDFDDDDMTQKVIGISQQIPYKGKLAAKSDLAVKEAEVYRWQIEERKLELAKMVKETYYGIWMADREADIITRNIDILDNFIKLAETKYTVGQGVQQDVIKAQVERSKMLEMRINLQQQRKSLEATLNNLLYRPYGTPVGKIRDSEIPSTEPSADVLAKTAEETRPIFRSLDAQIEKAKAAEKVASLDYYPDFNVSFEYMQRTNRDDMYSAGVTFNLPFRKTKREAMLAESRSEARMAEAEREMQKNAIRRSVGELSAQLERRRKLIELYSQGLIPQARQALESAMIAYRVGKVDFLTLLDSRMALYKYEREYYDSMADYRMKLAELEAVVGKEIR